MDVPLINVSAMVDDETLDIMCDLWNEIDPYIVELDIENEEIVQIPRVSIILIPPTRNVGLMMSLILACMDPTKLRSHSSTAVPEITSASQYT